MQSKIQLAVDLLNNFREDSECADSYALENLSKFKDLEGEEHDFIRYTFLGVIRYEKVLSIVIRGFFNRDGKTILRSEHNLYRVFAYLGLFQLDTIGITTFHNYVMEFDVNRMYKFLRFFFDDRNILTWMRDEWNKIYESKFVKDKLVSPLMRPLTRKHTNSLSTDCRLNHDYLPRLREVVDDLKSIVNCDPEPEHIVTSRKSKTTEIEAFNLTPMKARSIPVPNIIEKVKTYKKVPHTTYEEPKEKRKLDLQRELNRRQAEERLMDSTKTQLRCANPEKSEKSKNRIAQITEMEDKRLDFNRSKYKPAPNEKVSNNMPVKLNTVTILREGQLYKDREEQVLKKLEGFEAGAKDQSRFKEWQSKMIGADKYQEESAIEQRRLAAGIAYESAIEAKESLTKDNRSRVLEMKAKAAEHMDIFLKEKLKEEEQNRILVKGVISGHDNSKIAKKKMQQFKAKIVQKMNEESKQMMRIALEDAESEMRERMIAIYEIRALESTRCLRARPLADLSSTAGHQLLCEMSIVELRERLDLAKIKQAKDEDTKRDRIINDKQVKHEMLTETIELISRHRTVQSEYAAIKMDSLKKDTVQSDNQNSVTMEMKKQLTEKKALRLQQRMNIKSAPKPRLPSRNKKSIEEKRWQEMENTREKLAQKICAC